MAQIEPFWKDTLERAIKTFAESLIASSAMAVGLEDVDWWHALSVATLATLISVLMSCASLDLGDKGTAGAVKIKPKKARK